MSALGGAIESVYLDGIQFAGSLLQSVEQSFAVPSGEPVFVGNANSTPAYFVPESTPKTQARWDLQITIQNPSSPPSGNNGLKSATQATATANTNVYVWVPVNVPRDAVGMSFEFRLAGSGTNEYFTMGITNDNYFTMEAKFVDDGVWTPTSLIPISQYAGQSVQLFFSLNGDTPPTGVLTVRNIQFYSPPKPSLGVKIAGGKSVLSWPMVASGWQLEQTDSLSSSNHWTTSTNTPAVLNYFSTVTNDAGIGARFYRLRK